MATSRFGGVPVDDSPAVSKFGGIPVDDTGKSIRSPKSASDTWTPEPSGPLEVVKGMVKSVPKTALDTVTSLGEAFTSTGFIDQRVNPEKYEANQDKFHVSPSNRSQEVGEQIGEAALALSPLAELGLSELKGAKTAEEAIKAAKSVPVGHIAEILAHLSNVPYAGLVVRAIRKGLTLNDEAIITRELFKQKFGRLPETPRERLTAKGLLDVSLSEERATFRTPKPKLEPKVKVTSGRPSAMGDTPPPRHRPQLKPIIRSGRPTAGEDIPPPRPRLKPKADAEAVEAIGEQVTTKGATGEAPRAEPGANTSTNPMESGFNYIEMRRRNKDIALAKHFMSLGKTPEEVMAMSEQELDQASRGLGYDKFRSADQGAKLHRPHAAAKTDIVKQMRALLQ